MKFVADKILPACTTPDAMASTGGDTMFLSGLVGMICQGSWCVNNFYNADNSSDYAWAKLPYTDRNGNGKCEKEERCSIYNGLGWSIYSKTDKKDAAWSLISAFSSKEGQEKQSELGVTMAAYKGMSEPFVKAYSGMDISPFVDIEDEGTLVFRPYSKSTGTWESDVSDTLVSAWNAPEWLWKILCQDMRQLFPETVMILCRTEMGVLQSIFYRMLLTLSIIMKCTTAIGICFGQHTRMQKSMLY